MSGMYIRCNTPDNTPPRTIFKAGFFDNGEGVRESVLNTTSDASVQRSRRNLSKYAAIFFLCVPSVLEKTGSEIRPRGGVLLILVYGMYPRGEQHAGAGMHVHFNYSHASKYCRTKYPLKFMGVA